jgi:hypothetical protein
MLQREVGSEGMSMLDSFYGYNRVRMDPKDVPKTTFTTLWGTFGYVKMPFRLVNVGATFQRDTDYAFANIKVVFIVTYLDDLIILSKIVVDHLEHLN